ncbi:MAG: class I SAM-dependent methyltransferase [Solirubrobacterales bacterium]
MSSGTEHWNAAYSGGDSAVSWFQAEARTSLDLIGSVADSRASVIDVGGGSSRLVDGLIDRGHADLAVLDLADTGLEISRRRLGVKADDVEWIVADLLEWEPPRTYDVWHDRAVLHFLTDEDERQAYLAALRSALNVGGHAVIGVFAEDGPERCSGLAVRRYSLGDLRDLLGGDFETVGSMRELHRTPGGNQQAFNWLVARRTR